MRGQPHPFTTAGNGAKDSFQKPLAFVIQTARTRCDGKELHQFGRAEQAVGRRRPAGVCDHSVRIGLCAATIIVFVGRDGVGERYGWVNGDMHDARFFEMILLCWRQRLSGKQSIAGSFGAKVKICVEEKCSTFNHCAGWGSDGVPLKGCATYPPRESRARMTGPNFHGI